MKKGFTLLEVLLVIAILAILAAAIGPQFVSGAKTNLEATRKARFAANYQSCMLAASMFTLASHTSLVIRNDDYATFETPKTSGLGLLTASGTLTMDTCRYENNSGAVRWFAMKVNDGVSAASVAGQASPSIKLSTAATWAAGANIDPTSGALADSVPMEVVLRTKQIDQIWEIVKDK